ncbi:NUDIX domain-containing protein [Paenibacillus sp. IB182496]|uniref:NUDIX domain-containing protein n=1 Tax=Paenibacillus sabuli TaxID=2772509 RepID=A0A927GTT9_9BACL|nr:NUDIX domain-containing protein [Paenibacillus sabuli]MBD2848204.1 NUDIX domain-containing protein [Paenibacillus sabuli]
MTEERLDIYDASGRPLGTATRAEAHRQGYWHRTLHCWLARRGSGALFVRFQRRHAAKDTYPGCFDVTAAGHLAAGETVREATREIEEELGVAAPFEALIPLGEVREERSFLAHGRRVVDREFSAVYGWLADLPLEALRPQPEEVAGIYEAELPALIALFEDEVAEIRAAGYAAAGDGRLLSERRLVRADAFVPRRHGYYSQTLRRLAEALGQPY